MAQQGLPPVGGTIAIGGDDPATGSGMFLPPVGGTLHPNGTMQAPGMLEPPTIDPSAQPRVKNPDGSTSTVRSISIEQDGKEILIPTVAQDGSRLLTDQEAIQQFQRTKKHLGIFDSVEHATAFAKQLHEDYAAGRYDGRPQAAPQADEGGIGAMASGFLQTQPVHPIAAGQALLHPLATLQGIGQAQGQLFDDAKNAFAQGDYVRAGRKFGEYLVPLLGPMLSHAGDEMAQGHFMRGLGETLGIGANLLPLRESPTVAAVNEQVNTALKGLAEKTGIPVDAVQMPTMAESPLGRTAAGPVLPDHAPPGTTPASPLNTAAQVNRQQAFPPGQQIVPGGRPMAGVTPTPVPPLTPHVAQQVGQFADQHNVPIPAGARTTSWPVRALQDINAKSSLAAQAVDKSMQGQYAGAMERTGGQLAGRVSPQRISGVGAARAVKNTITDLRTALKATANAAYDRFRRLEADPRYTKQVPETIVGARTAGGSAIPIPLKRMVPMQLPVDLRMAKAALKPIFERLAKQWPEARKATSPGYTALKNIVEGNDFLSASELDGNLSGLKTIAREQGGVAKKAVGEVEQALQRTLATAGPEVRAALEEGRAAVRQRAEVDAVLKSIGGLDSEPQTLFERLTKKRDAYIDHLRRLEKIAPETIPVIGRGLLEEMFDRAFHEPGIFDHAAALYGEWEKLGPETKKLLYPTTAKDIGLFFRTASEVAKVANPSQSGYLVGLEYKLGKVGTLMLYNPLGAMIEIPLAEATQAAVARWLWTPGAAKLLTLGMTTPAAKSARAIAVAAEIVNSARQAGVAINMAQSAAALPKIAQQDQQIGPYRVQGGGNATNLTP
jgi:hypothetical protein